MITKKITIAIVSLGFSIFFFSCTPLKISRIENGQTIEKQGIIFYLPQTEINVVINTEYHNEINGQFSKEAQNLLPIKQKNSIPRWQIKDIQLQPIAEPDSSQCYLLQSGKKISQIQLNDKSIILGFNLPDKSNEQIKSIKINNFSSETKLPDYNNYFIKKNKKDIIDTIYTVIKRDSSSYTKRSFVKKEIEKSKTDCANDIYKYLIKVRKRKFKLLIELDDSISNLKTRFYHLDSLEKALNTLITREKIITPYTFNFRFLPDSTNLTDTIAFFSNIYGINNSIGKPIIIKIVPLPKFNTQFVSKTEEKGLPYRLPQQGIIRLFLDSKLLTEQQIAIAQTGEILELPNNLFKNKNITISYSPLTGQIKDISNHK